MTTIVRNGSVTGASIEDGDGGFDEIELHLHGHQLLAAERDRLFSAFDARARVLQLGAIQVGPFGLLLRLGEPDRERLCLARLLTQLVGLGLPALGVGSRPGDVLVRLRTQGRDCRRWSEAEYRQTAPDG